MRLWKIIKLAIRINNETKNGKVIITCPTWLAGQVNAYIWQKNVERAAQKWAAHDGNVSLSQWQESITRKTRQREEGTP